MGGGCWGRRNRAREKGRKAEAGFTGEISSAAPLRKTRIFEVGPETGCGFPFKGLVPHMDTYYQLQGNTVAEAVPPRVRAQPLEGDRLLAV